jgi:23S rRNA pseudouridine1911/1915/1917 synthase
MSRTVELVVPTELDGSRADRAVATLTGISRSAARRVCESGAAMSAGRAVEPADRIAAGSDLVVTLPEEPTVAATRMEIAVLYEDDLLLVVDKPAGLVVHPGAGHLEGTLVSGLLAFAPELESLAGEHRWGLVHRLDRGTSGTLLVAKSAAAHRLLQRDLAARRIGRSYLALVHGALDAATGTIDAPLDRDARHPTRRAVAIGGRPARTHYARVAEWVDVSLVDVKLETGRTHQIRVHFASIGHAVVGDKTYGRPRQHPSEPGRMWLHARELRFSHPEDGREIAVAAPLPDALVSSLQRLGEPRAGTLPAGLIS